MDKKNFYWILPILLMAVITPFTPWLDLSIERYFYNPGQHFSSNSFYDFMFEFAVIPAEIVGILAFLILCASYVKASFKKWRSPALVMVLTMVLGAGFICHTLLKDHWGRPRPKQTIEFGGMQPFRPYYKPNFFHQPEPSKSFPCGHCTMGFYFFALALVALRLGKPRAYLYLMIFSLIFGFAFGLARMAQGGHYLSDVLMTAVIMWLTAYLSDWLIYKTPIHD
jgi:lipid A 4'-phosphatase